MDFSRVNLATGILTFGNPNATFARKVYFRQCIKTQTKLPCMPIFFARKKLHKGFSMKNVKLSQAVKLAILAASGTAIALPATAQEELEEITVTGSRIVRSDLESVSPLAVIDNEEFVISGNLNVELKLNELPLTLPSFGPSSNNPGDGTARVDLRGIGTSRTLVLVNGRRYIPATQFGVVDLNSIPGTLIRQVDVVTGGASAVYGSDALAGVVNFQMRDDFEGVEITGLWDQTTDGDAEKYNFDITLGGNWADGRGNAVLYSSYSKREALFQGDRAFSSLALRDANPVGTPGQDSSTGAGGPLVGGGSSGTPGTTLFFGAYDPVAGVVFPDIGFPSPCGTFCGTFNADGSGTDWDNVASRFNYAPDNYLQLPQERYLTSAMGHFDITETFTAFTEITYTHNEVPQELAPTPAFLSTVEVNPDSPFFAPAIQAGLDLARSDTNGDGVVDGNDNTFLTFIGRRMVENGPRQALNNRDAFRILVGGRGDINDEWGYDFYYSLSNLTENGLLNNDVSDTRFRQAVLVNDAGTACQDPGAPPNPCAPMNIFGPGNINQAAIDFVNVGASNVTTIKQEIIQATVNGSFGGIGDADPIGISIGFERRNEDSSFRPDEFLAGGDVLGFNAGQQTIGRFDVTEVFGEIDIPLLSGVTGAESLSIWAAARASDYSNISSTVNSYAGAINWAPIEQVRLRGGFQRAVRAPNIGELFGGIANGFPGATDPCSNGGSAVGTAPGNPIYDTCLATGVAAADIGNFDQSNSQIEGLFGGNPNLIEEESDTVTLGVVIQPIDSLDITIDYFDITVDNAIFVLGGGVNNVLDICYNQVQDTSSPFCQAISRRPDGNVKEVRVLNENIGDIETNGIDLSVQWVQDFDFGFFGEGSTVAINLRATFLDTFDVKPVTALPDVETCAGTFGDICGEPRPEQLYNTRVTWVNGPLTVSVLWRFLDDVESDRISNNQTDPATLSVPKIDSQHYVDLSAAYQLTDSFRLNLGIKNILDEEPTFVGSDQEQANTFPSTYDVIGPRVFASASYVWD